MPPETADPSEIVTFERTYPGTKDQVRAVRTDLGPFLDGFPAADDLVLIASEISTNAVLHSRSGTDGQTFTVRAETHPGQYVWVEVEDRGGDWSDRDADDEHGRGLDILAAIAGGGNWGIETGNAAGSRLVWARLDWA